MQCLRFHYSCFPRSKIEAYFYILPRVFVQYDDGNLSGGKPCGVGGCIYSFRLQLRREVALEEGPAAELSRELEAVAHGFHCVF